MQFLIRFLLFMVVFAAGCLALVVCTVPQIGVEIAVQIELLLPTTSGRIVAGVSGGTLVLLPMYAVLRWWAGRRYAREISYATESGRVSVSLIAIEEALTRVLEQEAVVRKVQTRVFEDRVKRAVVIDCALTLWDDGDVSSTNRRCQELMRRRFAELMPEQRAVQIHISVHRLSHRRETEVIEAPAVAAASTKADGSRPSAKRAQATTTEMPVIEPQRVLPGLAATHGAIDNQAGAELLRARMGKRRQTDGAAELQHRVEPGSPDQGLADSEQEPASGAGVVSASKDQADHMAESITEPASPASEDVGDDDDSDDFYHGPNYLVDEDDDEHGPHTTVKPVT